MFRSFKISLAKILYLLKIKGKARIPDYIQVRDESFALIGYFRADRLEKGLKQINMPQYEKMLSEKIGGLPFGKLVKINL